MRNLILHCIMLVFIILVVYTQAGDHEFVFDDIDYVTNNPHVASGITGKNIFWAFTSVHSANWHPITWLSHMADVQIFGMHPFGHHLTNVFIHSVSALLLLLLLFRVTGSIWQSSIVATLFALHPLHVESVAWVAERKDVLSAFFGFITLIFYSEYVKKLKTRMYIFALIFYILGLMSKQMLVTLPIVMLLMDFWPLDRYRPVEREQMLGQFIRRGRDLIKEKIPFFACGLLAGFVTLYAQNKFGAIKSLYEQSFELRVENALISYVKYIIKTLWPSDLAVLYPFPSSFPLWQVIASMIFLLLASAASIRFGRRYPYLPVGWFWYLVTLLPVIGLIQVGHQSMADRYSYIPITGLFIIIVWGVSDLTKCLQHRIAILATLSVVILITLTALTWHQLGYWRNNISLYQHTLQVTTGSYLIHYNLGLAFAETGQIDAAIQEYQKALQMKPNYANARYDLGIAFASKGDMDAAINEYK